MKKPLSQRWNLDSIYPGGSSSEKFQEVLDAIAQGVARFRERVSGVSAPRAAEEAGPLAGAILELEALTKKAHQAAAFTSCLTAQDTADAKAKVLRAKVRQLSAEIQAAWTLLDERFLAIPDELWQELLAAPELAALAAPLDERRRLAKRRLSPDREALVSDLAVDGYHAWGELYNNVSGAIRIPFERDGEEVLLSVSQAQNLISELQDLGERARLFERFEAAWTEHGEVLAAALNHLAGFRLTLYRHRGWRSVLDEPLELNRMRPETLEAMWEAVDQAGELLSEYLKRKAQLLGVERLRFWEIDAPLGRLTRKIEFDEAAEMIVASFENLSPAMGAFARRAFEEAWIEAEDRPGKRAGGFCTWLPESSASRIFLTYDKSFDRAETIAHELGHAFHHAAFEGVPYLCADYPTNLAETASTLAEQLFSDALLSAASGEEERLLLLDARAQRCVTFLMNIRARFLFELDFYREREKGLVPVDRLNELMAAAQKRAYRESLGAYHPLFWASKLHFYLTGTPFYNFPYTFGYLFSQGIYEWALSDPKAFERRYVELLRDTGVMPTEELARKHFGVELTGAAFWRQAVERAVAPVKAFLEHTAAKE